MTQDISGEVQKEVARIRDTISTTKALLPGTNCNFAVYESIIAEAERAVRDQDATVLVRLLPTLKEME